MPLTPAKRKFFKARAHNLNPVIITGNKGITDSLMIETDRALETHELIKIRVNAVDREERGEMIKAICAQCHAELVGTIGHIAILYRKKAEEAPKKIAKKAGKLAR